MQDLAILWDWLAFAVRWLHIVTAIAWVGSSFYFIALDLGLRQPPGLPPGVRGEEWQVHGGGFYHIRKYLVAPEAMPDHLTWFKWESYATWLSGAALLAIVYWSGAELFMIDPGKMNLSVFQAILISAGSLAIGWLVYDLLCKSGLGEHPSVLMVLLFVLLTAMAWGYNQVFTGRAALLHLGSFTATIMTANVFLIIIPNQRVVVACLKAGETPDERYGRIAKLRSTHNNYLTLPVVFLMLSNHYPLAFATEYNWIIASLVFPMGVLIRHFFNSLHGRTGNPAWTWLAAAILFIVIVWLSAASPARDGYEDAGVRPLSGAERIFANAEGFDDVARAIPGRCAMCHAREPFWDGVRRAPGGIVLETPADIARAARQIYLQAGVTKAMPPANVSLMKEEERRAVVRWYRGAARNLALGF